VGGRRADGDDANRDGEKSPSRAVKLIRIKFTSSPAQSAARSKVFQDQLDAWASREVELSDVAMRLREELAEANSSVLQKSLARINDELQLIDARRSLLLATSRKAPSEAETGAEGEHEEIGIFGYQVIDETGSRVAMVVDDAGAYLHGRALCTYEVVDENPPLPQWAKTGKVGRFE